MGDAPVTPSISNLELTWASVLELCADLTEAQWKTATGCPGWTVQDQIAHLIDFEATLLGRPRPEADLPADRAHLKNPLGEANEVGVEARRPLPGAAVLEELREVTVARSAQLRALAPEDLAAPMDTPAGPGTLADMLTLRVMDTWSHEQDIRRALDRPGHAESPAVDEAVRYWTTYLPYVVGKRAKAPEGAGVRFEVGDRAGIDVVVTGGRAALQAIDGTPTVTLRMSAPTFAAHVGGRTDAPQDIAVDGDAALGQAVVASLGFMP